MGQPTPTPVKGKIQSITLSAMGPNSGELTLVISAAGSQPRNVYAGILDQNNSSNGIEHGAFAGLVSIAALAHSMGDGTYLMLDKERINSIQIG